MDKKKLRPTFDTQRVTWTVLQAAKGKTIKDIEYGLTEAGPDCHQGEAIILYFWDGGSLRIAVGSNAVNLAEQFKGLKPTDVYRPARNIREGGPGSSSREERGRRPLEEGGVMAKPGRPPGRHSDTNYSRSVLTCAAPSKKP